MSMKTHARALLRATIDATSEILITAMVLAGMVAAIINGAILTGA